MPETGGERLTEMREARDALYPRSRSGAVDTIDVARWDAFEHGWKARAALSAPVREVTDEELERVAKAIVADDQENNSCDPGWDAMSEPERDEYRSNARAALSVTRPIEAPGRDA